MKDISKRLSRKLASILSVDEAIISPKLKALQWLGLNDLVQWLSVLINTIDNLYIQNQILKQQTMMNEELYQRKFHNEFHEGCTPTVINEAYFYGPIYTGTKREACPTRDVELVNAAIRKLIADSILTQGKQWYAIYRVLTQHLNYPTDMKAFCNCIEQQMTDLPVPCVYENWRKAANEYPKLAHNVDLWDENAAVGSKEEAMVRVAIHMKRNLRIM